MPKKTMKAWHDAQASVVVDTKGAGIYGDEENYVHANEKGVTIRGPMAIVDGSSQIRFSGLWAMNTEMMLSLPSTMATPTPVMMINPPVAQFVDLARDAAIMMALFGMI